MLKLLLRSLVASLAALGLFFVAALPAQAATYTKSFVCSTGGYQIYGKLSAASASPGFYVYRLGTYTNYGPGGHLWMRPYAATSPTKYVYVTRGTIYHYVDLNPDLPTLASEVTVECAIASGHTGLQRVDF